MNKITINGIKLELTDDEANREIQRHGWETEPEHKCPLCYQGKWGTH